MVEIAVEQDDIKLSCDTSATLEARHAVACQLETIVHDKLFKSEEGVDDKTKKKFKPMCIDMERRIGIYRNRVKTAKKLTGGPTNATLIELSELCEIERNNALGTPEDNRPMRDCTGGR